MTAAQPTPPQMPYRVTSLPYGMGRMMPTKFYGSRGGEILSPDEIKVWEYVQWLEAENKRLEAENAKLLEQMTTPTEAPAPAPAEGQRRKRT